ncbi:BCCT family transporter [Staphylococcus pseudintermedius]|uniref:BCCT family transporter n=1 Tax=Staphylococcus pseudintermedius TaxID=283734 RepID=UPI00397F9551
MVPILSVITMLLVGTFFIISDDSATFILGMQTSHDSLTPTGRVKVIGGLLLSLIAFALLLLNGGAGLGALQ